MIFIIISLILLVIGLIGYHFVNKPIDRNNVQMINGGVGSGKSSTALWNSVYVNYRKEMRKYKIKKFLFRKRKFYEPCIYSNVPLFNVPYKEFKLEHLTRDIALPPKSITYLNECTLIADSMLAYNIGKDEARMRANKQLQLFCKLIRHETKGGCNGVSLILDTQSPNDLAMGGDRVLSQCNYIIESRNLPFFRAVKIVQLIINVPNMQNVLNDDLQGHWYLVPKRVFSMYDSMCYHFLSKDKIQNEPTHYIQAKNKWQLNKVKGQPFIIPTLTNYYEIKEYNAMLLKKMEKEKGEKQNGETKQNN